MAVARFSFVALFCVVVAGGAPTSSQPEAVKLRPTGSVLARTSQDFVGVTLDLWRADDPSYGAKWGNASALTITLTPWLSNLARGIGGVLRIGGSPEDSLVYQPLGGSCPTALPPLPALPSAYYCSQVRPAVYDCLTTARWAALNDFASNAGLKLVLGLNGCLGRTSTTDPIDVATLARFFTDTAKQQLAVFGFEVGNELDGSYSGSDGVDPSTLGRDLGAIAAAIRSVWPQEDARPILLAPDIAAFTGGTLLPPYFAAVVAAAPAGSFRGLTFHQYPYCSPNSAPAGQVLSLACLSKLDASAEAFTDLAAAHGLEAWVGESANLWEGGRPNVTDSFCDLFYFAYNLQAMALRGVTTVLRQTLVGGDYELVDRNTMMPNPSYWLAVAWRQLVAPVVLELANSSLPLPPQLRVSLHCSAAPGVARPIVFVVNFATNLTFLIDVASSVNASGGELFVHLLTADTLSSRTLLLNGRPLVPGSDGAPPLLQPLAARLASPFLMPPGSLAFVQPASGALDACTSA